MNLGMLRAQPRHVLVKLNDMSSGEAHQVLNDLPVVEWLPDGTPLYGVPQCRERTAGVRNEPVATVKAVAATIANWHEEQIARQAEQIASVLESVTEFKEEVARTQEENRDTRARIAGVWKATVANNPKESPGISPEQVGGMVGKEERWDAQRVRKYAREGKFPKSLRPRKKNAPYVFDPIMVLEDIANIKKGLRKSRGKS